MRKAKKPKKGKDTNHWKESKRVEFIYYRPLKLVCTCSFKITEDKRIIYV